MPRQLMSNILFKYGPPDDPDEEPLSSAPSDGSSGPSAAAEAAKRQPADVKFIDFQSARFTSLATDLVYFIFTSIRVSKGAICLCGLL